MIIMCGRFALTEDWSQITAYFGITEYDYAIPPRYNIAPNYDSPYVSVAGYVVFQTR
ncbi:SOS response-associated peptidase family protein [Alicyclobacillus suci]|uniref:SOS response-associated peptidase family protein n=1 Tax=Alicyclobacillus suci TaxID=2816080 RepID=UPI0034DDC9DA